MSTNEVKTAPHSVTKQMALSFRDLSFRVTDKSNESGKRVIIQNQSGNFAPGELVAIMGSSGAGKTTLLNILADRQHGDISGKIYLNNQARTAEFAKDLAYVTQDDIMLETLTPREMLRYAAKLQLPEDLSNEQRMARVEEVLSDLNILKCADTIVGTPGLTKGLSGGERKRLNIALSLIKLPSVIFLDEPTSGLDASTAFNLIETLRQLASQGRTIVTTIHQPSSSIFEQFDKLYLMAAGEVVYCGPARKAVDYFASLGYVCPQYTNPADFLMEIIQSEGSFAARALKVFGSAASLENLDENSSLPEEAVPRTSSDSDTIVAAADNGKAALTPKSAVSHLPEELRPHFSAIKTASLEAGKAERVKFFIDAFKTTGNWTTMTAPIKEEAVSKSILPNVTQAGVRKWFRDLWILTCRAAKCAVRDKFTTRARMGQTLGMGIIAGLLYLQVNSNQDGVRDRQGALFFCVMNMLISAMMSILFVFPKERAVFLREYMDAMYSPGSYFMGRVLVDIPYNVIPGLLFSIISYFMIGFQINAAKFFTYFGLIMLMCLNGSGLAMFITAGVANADVAVTLAPAVFVPMMLFAGFYVKLDNIPVFIRWLQWLSSIKYGLEAAFINEMSGVTFTCTDAQMAGPVGGPKVCPIQTGEVALELLGYNDVPLWRPLIILLALTFAWRLLAFWALKRTAKRVQSA